MQIRLNASNLEDWARANRLPTKMVSVHFGPLNHLLQWLQCLSSESSIDGLIGTIQSLRSLNPLQLRRAVRDYRYEVDETKMDEECSQYLVQIQKQWERQRMQKTVDGLASPPPTPGRRADMEREAAEEEAASVTSLQEDASRMIDEVFCDPNEYGNYSPPRATEALGELLNSRYMVSLSFFFQLSWTRLSSVFVSCPRSFRSRSHLWQRCSSTLINQKHSDRLLRVDLEVTPTLEKELRLLDHYPECLSLRLPISLLLPLLPLTTPKLNRQ